MPNPKYDILNGVIICGDWACGRKLTSQPKTNFAPQSFGFAWSPFSDDKTCVQRRVRNVLHSSGHLGPVTIAVKSAR